MSAASEFVAEGGCDCRAVRYRLMRRPLIVHCCHCRWCQRESGASFALNAMIESQYLEKISGRAEMTWTPSESGKGQLIARCPVCRLALWSHYSGLGARASFVRVGTLDEPDRLPPDMHIFTASKQPFVALDERVPAFEEYYDWKELWPAESKARREALMRAA